MKTILILTIFPIYSLQLRIKVKISLLNTVASNATVTECEKFETGQTKSIIGRESGMAYSR